MWIVGGDVNQGHYHADVWYSTDGARWTQANPSAPVPWAPRALHYTVAMHDRIWIMGGQTVPQLAADEERRYSDLWNSEDGLHGIAFYGASQPGHRGMIGGSAVLGSNLDNGRRSLRHAGASWPHF